jgi:dolichol-phosphate mannosyltransferase
MPETLDTILQAAPAGPFVLPPVSTDPIGFTLVVPTFNECENIAAFLRAARDELEAALPGQYEIVVVDDDSPDRTWEIAAQALPGFPQLRVVRRQGERGLATGVMRGYQIGRGDVLGTINADFQHPPSILPLMLAQIQDADLVIASRYIDGAGLGAWPIRRRIASRGAHRIGRLFLPQVFNRVSDPLSGCYMFRRAAVAGDEFHPLGYKTLMEILALGRIETIRECPYHMRERRLGRSKVTAIHWYQYLHRLWRLRSIVKSRARSQ